MAFYSPDPRKVLHDMSEKGLLEHTKRGKYRVRSLSDYVRLKNHVAAAYDLLASAALPYALTGADGVFVWTEGGYNAGRFFGFYPIHLRVLKTDLARWRGFFRRAGKKFYLAGMRPKETVFGIFYLLYPEKRVASEVVKGFRVEPLKETVEFCRKNIYTYEPAFEMLQEKQSRRA